MYRSVDRIGTKVGSRKHLGKAAEGSTRGNGLTVRFASKNIILSFMCFRGDAVSPEDVTLWGAWEDLGALTMPLELLKFDGRCVIGLVP